MTDLKICRICLVTEVKMFRFNKHQLKYYYEDIMDQKTNERDGLPQYFCYECATLLEKCHKFKEKCKIGQKTLYEIKWRETITYEAVSKIDRKIKNLNSSLQILSVTKKVKTYTTKENFKKEKIEIAIGDIHKSNKELDTHGNMDNDPFEDPIEDPINDTFDGTSDDPIDDPNEDPFEDAIDDSIKESTIKQKPVVEIETKPTQSIEHIENKNEKNNQVKRRTLRSNKNTIKDKNLNLKTRNTKTISANTNKRILKKKSSEAKDTKKNDTRNGKTKLRRVLDWNSWKKINLSEDEAVIQFRQRAEDAKYLASAYKCTDCFKGFSKEDMLNRHIKLRHDEAFSKHECRFCKMRFKWDCQLRPHMKQHYTKYECLKCDLVCPLETTAVLHEDYHTGVTRKCLHCDREFRHLSTYYTHLRSHRSEFVCTLCGVSFVSSAGLKMHKRVKHITNDNDEIKSPDNNEDTWTYCEKCDIRFKTRKAYDDHFFHSAKHCEGVEDEISNEGSIPRKVLGKSMQEMITKHLQKRKLDGITEGGVIKRSSYMRKYRKPTTCNQCGKHFETQAACLRHHLAEHPRTSFYSPSDRHICEICGISLAPNSISTHLNIHSREKLFPCDTCGRQFNTSIGLKTHRVTHTGEKPHACTLCDKRFTQSSSLNLHYNTFHLKLPYPKR